MAKNDAFRQLSGPALKILVEMRCRYNGGNNGRIVLSMDEAARLLCMSKGTVSRALEELQAKGWVKLKSRGRWYGRKANEWTLTMCSMDGLPATNDWRLWQSQKSGREAKKIISRYSNGVAECADGIM